MASVEHNPALQLRLERELAQRLRWSALAYALFATLSTLNLLPGTRWGGLVLSGLLAILGTLRTIFAFRVIKGRDAERDGKRLTLASRSLSITFGVFVSMALWRVQGHPIAECLLALGVVGIASVSASMFAPSPELNRLNVWAQLVPLYTWAVFAEPRYGWLLEAFVAIHGTMIVQTIRMNGLRTRDMFLAQIALEAKSEDLRQARDAADMAARAKMRFLANMSHEIRTPLNGIIGLAEVLERLSLTDEQRVVLDDIGRSGNHLLAIVNDVLDMAKISSGKLSLEHVPFDLRQLVRDLASPAAALAETRQLRFVAQVPEDLSVMVRGDPLRIRQVVSNLLSNAVKFTPSGEVRLVLEVPRAGWIRFAVSDTGIGLSAEEQLGLFQEFHQVDSSSTRKFGGSGLGLAISHRLTVLMGGNLQVESRVGEGSTFFLDLPLAASETPGRGVEAATPVTPQLPARLRVLLAEDNAINQKVIVMLLAQAGICADVAEDGKGAIERHRTTPYDVILMDCQMPGIDGYEATVRIRRLPGPASLVPIIGVTANAFAEDRDRCLRAGMNGYLAKPLSRATLMAAISEAIARAVT